MHFLLVIRAQAVYRNDLAGVLELLEIIFLRACYPLRRAHDTLARVQPADDGRAEFVIHSPTQQEVFRALYRAEVERIKPDGLCVKLRSVLDVHRHSVDKSCADDVHQPLRERAVCVQLYHKAEGAYFLQKRRELLVQQRLAAGHRNAVQYALPLAEKEQKFVLAYRAVALPCKLRQHKRSVMAEGAAEIAARCKQCTRDLAGVIQQRELLQSGYEHNAASLRPILMSMQYNTVICCSCQEQITRY